MSSKWPQAITTPYSMFHFLKKIQRVGQSAHLCVSNCYTRLKTSWNSYGLPPLQWPWGAPWHLVDPCHTLVVWSPAIPVAMRTPWWVPAIVWPTASRIAVVSIVLWHRIVHCSLAPLILRSWTSATWTCATLCHFHLDEFIVNFVSIAGSLLHSVLLSIFCQRNFWCDTLCLRRKLWM